MIAQSLADNNNGRTVGNIIFSLLLPDRTGQARSGKGIARWVIGYPNNNYIDPVLRGSPDAGAGGVIILDHGPLSRRQLLIVESI